MSVSYIEDAIQTQNGGINLWRSKFSLGLNLSSIWGACKRAIHVEMCRTWFWSRLPRTQDNYEGLGAQWSLNFPSLLDSTWTKNSKAKQKLNTMKEKPTKNGGNAKRLWGFVFNATYPEQYIAYQTFKKTWKNGEVACNRRKPEESAIIEAKRREHFKKDWLKLCSGHEETCLSNSQQKGCTGMF